ncbi:hypothetical protein ACFFSY_21440 [Paenibacillus aurantiacus]|uniref:Uncharacterized protein n=1 Tax=Paenibacillus aurantiacus TaxID=1936118 RepID=A0ABV5KTE3_9BACL
MTRQYAIDKAKIYFREQNRSFYVVQMDASDFEVLDKEGLDRVMQSGKIRRDAIIFSMENDPNE